MYQAPSWDPFWEWEYYDIMGYLDWEEDEPDKFFLPVF